MHDQRAAFRPLTVIPLLVLCLLLVTTFATAQEDIPPPQFLYRSENRLVLVNGYTGETTELPLDVTEQDRFSWSPDGQYLLAWLQNGEELYNYSYCLNLYDVDAQAWLYSEPLACAAQEAVFSGDGTRLVYSTSDGTNGTLWGYSLAEETREELYRTTGENELYPSGISYIRWSPTETYLTFVSYRSIMGGTLNYFIVMDIESQDYFTLSAPSQYYASYNPDWSAGDRWFLIILQDEYVTSGSLPLTNHRGDLYLVNSETGEPYRLTYSPAAYEQDVRWTEDGGIAFTEVIERDVTLTIEQAMQVEIVPPEDIVTPEPYDVEAFVNSIYQGNIVSPDTNVGAWVEPIHTEQGEQTYELNIGNISSRSRTSYFSVPLPNYAPSLYDDTLIGWRPSDYPYGMG